MFNFNDITFVNGYFLWFLVLVPGLVVWYYYQQHKRFPTLNMSDLSAFGDEGSLRGQLSIILPILRALAFVMFVIALARPQATLKQQNIKAEGIDIILSMDVSSSMLARDFTPDRLEASKAVADEFVDRRPYDRIGLVVFSGEAFTQCPATTDHKIVKEFLAGLKCGFLEDGTAIGMGLATAVNRLKDSEAKSKVVILLTDGVNNSGYIDPLMAAEIAREFNVRVYTIGVGTRGLASVPSDHLINGKFVFKTARVEIDEELLIQISEMTKGKYFRATDENSLSLIYQEIDRLEKTKMDITTIKRYSEEYFRFIAWGLAFLLLELGLRYTVFRTIP
jgi:Ca-activated chloride channel family protein